MTISPYQPDIIHFDYKPFEWNVDLISKVLATKEQEYEQAYQGLDKLRKTSLSINFLNKKEQSKIDGFNKKIDQMFSGDMGDLADPNTAAKYSSLFTELTQNPTLMSNYREDLRWQNELRNVNEMKNSKDPKKAGYFPINEAVWSHHLQGYMEQDLGKESSQFQSYVPYVDRYPRVLNAIKALKPKKTVEDTPDGKGNIIRTVREGYDPNEVRTVTSMVLNDADSQLGVESYYRYMTGGENRDSELFNHYKQAVSSELSDNATKIKDIESELVKAKADNNQAKIQELEGKKAEYETRNKDLSVEDNLDLNTFMEKSEQEKVNYFKTLNKNNELDAFTNAYKPTVSTEVRTDTNYWNAANYGLKAQELQHNMNVDNAELSLKQQKQQLEELKASGKLADGTENPALGLPATSTVGQEELLKSKENIDNFEHDVKFGTTNFANGQNYNIDLNGVPADNDTHLRNILFGPREKLNAKYNDNPSFKLAQRFRDYYMPDLKEAYEKNKHVSQDEMNTYLQEEAKKYVNKFYTAMTEGKFETPPSKEEEAIYNDIVDNAMLFDAWANFKGDNYVNGGRTGEGMIKEMKDRNITSIVNGKRVFFEAPEGTDKDTKAILAQDRVKIANVITDNITDEDGTILVDPNYIAGYEAFPNGKMKVYFSPAKEKADGTGTKTEVRPTVNIKGTEVNLDGGSIVLDIPELKNKNLVKDKMYLLTEGKRYKYSHKGTPYEITWAGTEEGQPKTVYRIGTLAISTANKTPSEVKSMIEKYIDDNQKSE